MCEGTKQLELQVIACSGRHLVSSGLSGGVHAGVGGVLLVVLQDTCDLLASLLI